MKDEFTEVRNKIKQYKKRFPIFHKDIRRIETTIENHIKTYSQYIVKYKQSHSTRFLEKAQEEKEKINEVLKLVDKIELIAMLAK